MPSFAGRPSSARKLEAERPSRFAVESDDDLDVELVFGRAELGADVMDAKQRQSSARGRGAARHRVPVGRQRPEAEDTPIARREIDHLGAWDGDAIEHGIVRAHAGRGRQQEMSPGEAVERLEHAGRADGDAPSRVGRVEDHVSHQDLVRPGFPGEVDGERALLGQRCLHPGVEGPRPAAVLGAPEMIVVEDIDDLGTVRVDEEAPRAGRTGSCGQDDRIPTRPPSTPRPDALARILLLVSDAKTSRFAWPPLAWTTTTIGLGSVGPWRKTLTPGPSDVAVVVQSAAAVTVLSFVVRRRRAVVPSSLWITVQKSPSGSGESPSGVSTSGR